MIGTVTEKEELRRYPKCSTNVNFVLEMLTSTGNLEVCAWHAHMCEHPILVKGEPFRWWLHLVLHGQHVPVMLTDDWCD